MKRVYLILFLILILASTLRFYKIGIVPLSLTWDEAAVGYNAYSIATYGRDEYGKAFPIFFRSFGDDKHPIHIYTTAFFTKLFGSNDTSVRLPAAVFGVLNVFLLFSLTKMLFKKNVIALTAAFFLAISPYNIHFSRFNHEANFALFWFLAGLLLFYLSIMKKNRLLPFSVLSFAVCFITYHSSKIVVPAITILLLILYKKQLLKDKISFFISLFIGLIFLIFVILNSQLLGIARINQTGLDIREIKKTQLFKLTNNESLGRFNLVLTQYSWHFIPDFLFLKGDKNSRLSSNLGEFYLIDALFLITGLVYLIRKRSKEGFIVLTWALIAPLPSTLTSEAPHAARAMFMMGSWHLISALGFYSIINFKNKLSWKIISGVILSTVLIVSLFHYLNYYYGEFAKRYAIDWQYGMKQIVEYSASHSEFSSIVMTDERAQPYIFFLYYLKTPLPEYLNSVIYNNSLSKSYNNVRNFSRYYFVGADLRDSKPEKETIYVVTPSEYDGLRYKSSFDIKQIINYPNETVAFYIITTK